MTNIITRVFDYMDSGSWSTEEIPVGGGGGGTVTVSGYSFAWNTPGIRDGVQFYTPSVGDILMNAWFEVSQAWDGETPRADIATNADVSGYFSQGNGAISFSDADAEYDAGFLMGSYNGVNLSLLAGGAIYDHGFRNAPGKFTSADPLVVWVTKSGNRTDSTGTYPTEGSATIWIAVASAPPVTPL